MNCTLCPRHCDLPAGHIGFCRARRNDGNAIICINYGKLTSLALDPIEKKPLARFRPGSKILSAGSFGCNLRCPFCQNSDISMADERCSTVDVSPGELVHKALALLPQGNIGIAYTYNEPLIGYEYVRDCAAQAHDAGLMNVLVTNGFICAEPFAVLLPLIDALNIDLKGFTQDYYTFVGGDLETVKASIRMAAARCHVEVTTLIVPGLNDSPEAMEAEAKWLSSINAEIPLHISRYFPCYHLLDRPPTPVETIHKLRDIAGKHLRYVFTGNC
ncbi:MAG: AmmeMemoRadiSam system radical SAM enzyme [Eubacteriales bacterium]|nr:AmmeMemoRadiSam system radical SAM enzyme [Eubacteriales bacterium]